MHALVSIHDVAPSTLCHVNRIIERLPAACLTNLVLLIIPGNKWSPKDITHLRRWQERGFILAGHGWLHHCEQVRGWYHQLHSALLSRKVAEHLMLNEHQIAELLNKNYDWFARNKLDAPNYYVPPAWAMGSVSAKTLGESPFHYFETSLGILNAHSGRLKKLPLSGFEADNAFRTVSLRCWNYLNVHAASAGRPLRIGIHPYDDNLQLARPMWQLLSKVTHNWHYSAVFD
ncbi:hypothetical protein SAMN02745866_03082 [Alteromonadaceae bacterium Bs31]|nr:hypothetical protein SAMN02745866_03082 [Alteromonadaceae bacterium Bs31]